MLRRLVVSIVSSALAASACTDTEHQLNADPDGGGAGSGSAPPQLTDRDFVGIIWSLDSFDGQPPDPSEPPSLLIYREDVFFVDDHCVDGGGGSYVRDGATFSASVEGWLAVACEGSFVPRGLLAGQYTMQIDSGSLTLDGVGRAVYRSEFTAPIEGSGLTERTWQLVESDHPEFETTKHMDYVMQFESQGIRSLRVAWACGSGLAGGCNEELGSFGIDGHGGIDLDCNQGSYSSVAAGNADRALVADLIAASDYQVSGSTLTLRSHSPDLINFVFDGGTS